MTRRHWLRLIATASTISVIGMLSSSMASGRRRKRLAQLAEVGDLDLDLDEMAGEFAGALDRKRHPAGDRNVVVLDEDGVVEAEAVVGAAAATDRIFVESAQARNGLARAGDAGGGMGDFGLERAPYGWRCPTCA